MRPCWTATGRGRGGRMKRIAIVIIALTMGASVTFNFLFALTRFLRDNIKVRLILADQESGFKDAAKKALHERDVRFFQGVLSNVGNAQFFLEHNKNYKILKAFEDSTANMSRREKKQIVAYIPKSSQWFWEGDLGDCGTVPLLVPALTGLAALRGLPLVTCSEKEYRGYAGYDLLRSQDSLDFGNKMDVDSLCREVRANHFRKVLGFVPVEGGEIKAVFLDC